MPRFEQQKHQYHSALACNVWSV